MADQLLPVEDTAKEYYRVTKKNGDKETKLREQLTPSEVYAVDENNGKVKYSDYPQFTVNNGKVKVTGSSQYINSDIVNSTAKLIQDYYKGYDLSNNQVAESLQKSLDEVNKQIKANIQYQEYNNFLNSSGFSDQAYRNYVKAKEDADPKTNTNLLKNKNKYKGFKKDGTLTSDDEAMTAAEWFEYWKKNYTPEERIQLWLDSNSALSNAASDDDLYKALPYILMGAEEKQNVPAGIMNAVNPFNKEGYDDAKFYGPINGFEDVNSWDAFWDAFASTNKEALGSFVKWAGGLTTPLERALGPRYIGKNISTPEEWGKTNGLKNVTYDTIGNMSREEWNRIADKVNDYFFNTNKEVRNRRLEGGTDAEILEKYEGAEDAAKILFVRDFSVLKGGRDQGWDLYQNYRDLYNLQQTEGYKSPYEKWGAEKEKAMQEHIGRLNTIAPTSTTLGVIGGTLARHLAEQAALNLMTGGAFTASNIASKLASGGWKLGSNLMTKIGLGQKIAASHPALASAIHAMATSTATYAAGGKLADTAFKAGMTVADGAGTAAKVIYVLGSVGNWAVRELGEDAIRGIVDDAITGNSLDSQGNLDADKFLENVYMNAIMYGALKGIKGGVKGISSLVDNARTRDIDGVELNATQRSQLDLFQKALDDQNDRYKLSGYDGNNHPVITINGKNKVLDEVTLSENTAKAVEEATGVVAPTAARTVENILDDDRVPDATKQKIAEVLEENRVDVNNGKELTPDELKTKLQEKLSDDEIRQAFPDGTMKVGDQTVKITPKEFTSGDIGRVTGKEFSNMDDAINGLRLAETTSDFASSVNGIMRGSTEFATNFKNAVEEFANDHNMNVRDVMIAIRDSRIAGEETIPGLRELWENNWKPVQEKLLDLQEQITGVRPASHDFYFRDMIEGTFKPSASGAWSIDQGSVTDMLGGDADFDLAASSFARNTGKLADMASDKLEYDPEVLAREFVASRIQTIWESDKGKIFTTLQEAHDAGEFDLTEAEAARSVTATEQVGREVGESDGVKTIENLSNVRNLGEEFDGVKIESDGDIPKTSTGKTGEAAVEEMADLSKKQIVNAQKKFNESAAKSTSAEQISRTSGYKKRGNRVNAGPVVGVNYMPSNPFGKFAKWINDHFVKANSIKMVWKNANGEVTGSVTAYDGGYKMYAEAGSFARNVIVDIQNGANLWESIYKQVRDNGFFIEPTEYQKATYGALDASEQAARVTDKIMDRMTRGNYYYKWSDAFNDDGTVKNTEAVLSILTTRFRGQGINDFTKFIRKADWDSFSKEEQSWLNKRMYEMTASVNKKSMKNIITLLAKNSMGLRYKSNMWFNYKNAQLQLTEIQRLYTMNKIGDFGRTLKRLVSDSDYRQKVSDYTYIHAAESMGRGLSRQDLETTVDAMTKVGAGSTMSKSGMFTDIDTIKAKFGEINDDALAAIEGAEYTKNFMLIAGFVAAGEKQGLEGLDLDNYVRNRFNTEALAGTKVGKIGLTDSKIGQFAFMYLGFPIRELTLQWHTIRGGGIRGNVLGSLEYMAKMLGAKGLMWAVEAPWGYSLLDQLDVDPFGFAEQYDQVNTPYEDREPGWRNLDFALQYNPFFQGAMTSAMTDIYFSYRAAEEAAREAYKEEHGGSTDGFEWSLADAGAEMWTDLLKGLTPGYTAYSRAEGEITDLDRGYRTSITGNRMYETNTDPYNIAKGFLAGRRTTANAQDYYQTANPIRGLAENGLGGLGQQIDRGLDFNPLKLLDGKNPFRGFREFDPVDPDTYTDWFNGTYRDQQNWNTGIYAFKEEAQQIKEKYDRYANEGTAINSMASRENELADLRKRVEKYVKAYTDRHPEGISNSKQDQIINIFNLGSYQPTLDQAFQEAQGNTDYSDWEAAKNRYSQGDFPTAYGIKESGDGSDYARSPQLEQVLSQHRYGIASDVAPVLEQMYTTQEFDTPLGRMTMKDYHDKVYSQLQEEWNKSKTNYDKVSGLQMGYLEALSTNVIQPVLNTYGSAVLSAGKSSDIMQEFGKMLYSMVPSDDYRIDKKGKKIYKSTPYMTIDIKAWLNKNFKDYAGNINTTNRQTTDRLTSIRNSINQGHQSTAKAKARALVQDIGKGKASVSRDELEWLQGILK